MSQAKAAPKWRKYAYKLRKRGGIWRRITEPFVDHRPWWSWGHRLMALVGQDHGGNWSEPEPETWWYHRGKQVNQRFTGFPRYRPRSFTVIKDYTTFRELTEGLNEDEMYEWNAINVSDNELHLGHMYWGTRFYGMPQDETWLLLRYLARWRLIDWFGLRTWAFQQGLHAAVHEKVPFGCHELPPKESSGYNHWHCQLRRRHEGLHRFNSYEWGEVPGGAVVFRMIDANER